MPVHESPQPVSNRCHADQTELLKGTVSGVWYEEAGETPAAAETGHASLRERVARAMQRLSH